MPMFNDETVNDRIERDGVHLGRNSESEAAWYARKRREAGNPIVLPESKGVSKLPGDD